MPFHNSLSFNRVLITGAAGFIGSHMTKALLENMYGVFPVDKLDYQMTPLQRARVARFVDTERLYINLEDKMVVDEIFARYRFDYVVHLAAETGVRASFNSVQPYVTNNMQVFTNVIDAAARFGVKHFMYASSSSVYGTTYGHSSSEYDQVRPESFYAATKVANEAIATSYAKTHNLASTGLRFFTVYGPWGRPDMAPYKFTRAVLEGDTVPLYNYGNGIRDFTYVGDVVDAMIQLLKKPAYGHTVLNVGNGNPISTRQFLDSISLLTGKTPLINYMPDQPGDVSRTCANPANLYSKIIPTNTPLDEGLTRLINWMKFHELRLPE